MVVVCYTNHALDSFLELILPHLPTDKKNGLVRVGGRSKSEKLKECSLQNWTKLHGGAYGGVALPGIDRATRDRQFSLRREKKALQEHLHRAFRAWNTEAITEGALDCAGALSWETLPLLVLMARAAEQPRAAAGAAFEDAETEAGTRVTEDGDAFDFDEDDQSFFTSGEDQDGFASVTASETTANRPSSEPPAANVDITSVIERLIVSLRAVENQWSKVVAGLGRGRAKLPTSRGKKRPVALCSLLDRWLHSPRYQQLVVERRNRLQAQQQQRMAAAQHRWMAAIAGQNVISGPSYFAPLGDDGQGDSVIAS